jgi:hypothetical protein
MSETPTAIDKAEATRQAARSEAARLLGLARSARKARAARKNGRLGGRPKKRLKKILNKS